jgi:hypothetical protein
MENLALGLELPPGTTLEIPVGLKQLVLSGTGWELGFTPAGQISEAGVLTVPLGASNPIVISGYRPNSEVLVSVEKQSVSSLALLFGSGFVRTQSITPLGTFTTNARGVLTADVKLPISLTTGDYKLIVSGSSLLTGPVRVALPIVVTQAVDIGFAVWTKKFGLSQGKMYAKNPGGVGKVSFRLNGKEIAWVRAVDATDPKLRKVDVGPMAGVTYLVRTVDFVKGKNALEIYLNGKRVWRAAYTLR